MATKVTFLGATETVTGSNFLVETDNCKFLVDCGMYQGPDVEARNSQAFDFEPSKIDFVLVTHTHLDHVGLLPKLVRKGFTGKIYATMHTIQLATIILLDSAKIQEANFAENSTWADLESAGGLVYDTKDVEKTLAQFEAVPYEEDVMPAEGVSARYVRVAHVLGAASIELEVGGKKLVFSGDIGRREQVLVESFDPDKHEEVDYVIMEALYGGKEHPARKESVAELMGIIRETLARGGTVYIPAFAIQRTQELLNDLRIAKSSGALDEDVTVWIDSPMAQRVTEVYQATLDHDVASIFDFPGLRYVRNSRQSMKIAKRTGQIILAGSGMATGGRILGHLARGLKEKKNSVVFVGYQAEATLGREIVEGAKEVLIDDVVIPVKAEIHYLKGFSAHGDTNDYLTWVRRYVSPRLKRIFLIHSEADSAAALKTQIETEGLDHPYIPKRGESVELM